MSDVRSSNLRFHVQESVGFHRGQEVEDLISIALEPEIHIKENQEYVSILGSLLLSAEYRALEEGTDEETIESFRDYAFQRVVDEIRETEEGVYALEHRFPIDITIPIERITDLNDVYVMIESFDYEVPQSNHLQLRADIEISGITSEEAETAQDEGIEIEEQSEEEADEVTPSEPEEEVNDLPVFEVEVRREPEEEQVEEEVEEQEEMQVEMKARPEEEERYQLQPYTAEIEEEEPVYEEEPEEMILEEEETTEIEVEQDEEEAQVSVEHVKTHTRGDNALYLTKMLTSEREAFTKVKMRIIQQGDSLDTIADNYEVPITQILRVNQMESSNDLEEGQVLYIPVQS